MVPCGLALEVVGIPFEVCTVLKCGVSSSLTSEPCSIRIPLPLPSESSLVCKSLHSGGYVFALKGRMSTVWKDGERIAVQFVSGGEFELSLVCTLCE